MAKEARGGREEMFIQQINRVVNIISRRHWDAASQQAHDSAVRASSSIELSFALWTPLTCSE